MADDRKADLNPTAASTLAALADTTTVLLKGVVLPVPALPSEPEVESAAGSHPAAGAALGPSGAVERTAIGEPIYDRAARDDIQGNIIPGFNKDHQQFLFLRFGTAESARRWCGGIAPSLASMHEVLSFRREFRAQRLALGVREPGMRASWVSVAFSHRGISTLAGRRQADEFGEQSFRQGLAERSTFLGDPSDPAHPGHRDNWVVGGPGTEADALVIAAADRPADLDATVAEIRRTATDHGMELLFEQRGQTLPGNLQGHEHFGFKDGISQPGIRGAQSALPGDELTPRYLAETDPRAQLFAKPGQPLIWPGQVLLGEPRQDPLDPAVASPAATNFPDWARRGSYLVCRRLRQDVVAFWDFAATLAAELDTSPVRAAAILVGRWPSGAPLSRCPDRDDAVLAGDEFANNHFLFDDATRGAVLVPITGYPGDSHTAADQDILGRVCPPAAHIRKMNPRDGATDFGSPADTLMRLMLRRGIPFGEPLAGVPDPSPELLAAERGLLFAAYAATIEDQFEFVTRRWANSAVQPNVGGHDPIIGQRERRDGRSRTIDLPTAAGGARTHRLDREWVVPTGGGYFFAPPISAVAGVLAGIER